MKNTRKRTNTKRRPPRTPKRRGFDSLGVAPKGDEQQQEDHHKHKKEVGV
jgi:hypothetical protein